MLLDAFDCAPVEPGLERAVLHAAPAGGHEPLGEIAFPPAIMGSVDGQTEDSVAVANGALDVIVDPGRVAADIKLIETQRIGCRCGEVLEPGIADRAEHVRGTERVRRAHHRQGTGRMEAFQRSDRGEHDREPELAPEVAHRGIDVADVAQHPRPERDGVERHAVAPQRCFGFGAAYDVVPIVLVKVLPRLGDDFMQIEKVDRKRLDVVSRGFLGMPLLHECLLRVEGGVRAWPHDARVVDRPSTSGGSLHSTRPLASSIRCMLSRAAASRMTAPSRAPALGLTRPHISTPPMRKNTSVSIPSGSVTSIIASM